jgi:dTDP-4-amino-4,6-dideoxygalactose transaminase
MATVTTIPHYDLKAEYAELRDEILEALDRVGRGTSFSLGPEVGEFEKEFAAFCGAKYCVAVNSGTSALHLALLALGVQAGDEVITSPNTFIATAEPISYLGAKPVFVDIDPATANIDACQIERAINSRTRAIIPVHLYGRPADMDAVLEIARRHKLAVIEDACQAHGARYRGRTVGSLADAAAFSFYPSKNLGAYGEGGALVTNSDRIAEFARAARVHGQRQRYLNDFVGFNYRMDGFQGAVLRVKLRHLPKWDARRQEVAHAYRQMLTGTRLDMPVDDPRDECAYHLFVVYSDQRDCVRTQMEALGIETAIHYPYPLHRQPAYASLGYPSGTFPHAERACARVMSLPLFPSLTDEQVERTANALKSIAG